MYLILLSIHSVLRWLVLGGLVGRIALAVHGAVTGREPTGNDKIWNIVAVSTLHLQVVLGFGLFFISPLVAAAMGDMGSAMKDPGQRFFLVEHSTMMVIAAVIATVGSVLARKGKTAVAKHRNAAIGFGVALLIVLAAIPWPFRAAVGRGLLTLPW